MMTGVYIHIPFCASKCGYCDFLSFAAEPDLRRAYVDALVREISLCERLPGLRLESVFFGGGTPGMLAAQELAAILTAVSRKADTSSAEITLEANPGADISREKLRALRTAGFNRISLGLQAAQPHLLNMLGRGHTAKDFERAVNDASAAGFVNINADIMYALPGQTPADLALTLGLLTSLGLQHISAYALTIEDATPIARQLAAGTLIAHDEDSERAMSDQVRTFLANAGYAQYEISNFAKPGCECRHNKLYWTRQHCLAYGIGAHSFENNIRRRNTGNITDYIAADGDTARITQDSHHLDTAAQMEEFMFLGLRQTSGINADEFLRQFGTSLQARYGAQIAKHQGLGMLEQHGTNLRLTTAGTDVSNIVLADFLL
ncbi:MAG: radical SAM family heme chaperone HemW [Defluviitaleaceae bacterium]|nr:radical SAM family heme chaperone HemW [Defluviitaleaceae bacterium]